MITTTSTAAGGDGGGGGVCPSICLVYVHKDGSRLLVRLCSSTPKIGQV